MKDQDKIKKQTAEIARLKTENSLLQDSIKSYESICLSWEKTFLRVEKQMKQLIGNIKANTR
jgi:predicted RNase H-like nuclease (RuvC/YqgF family)